MPQLARLDSELFLFQLSCLAKKYFGQSQAVRHREQLFFVFELTEIELKLLVFQRNSSKLS